MMTETNLEKIKEIAISFLYVTPEIPPEFPFIVIHPFIGNNPYPVPNENRSYDFVDITKEGNLEKIQAQIEEVIHNTTSIHKLFMLLTPAHRRTFFQYIHSYLSPKDYGELLREIWIQTEAQSHDINVSLQDMVKWFKDADKNILMTEQERKILEEMPEEITVYRGCNEDKYYDAMSWTKSRVVAERFSRRFYDNGTIFSAQIKKKDVLAYFADEQEVVVDYRKIRGVKKENF